MARGALPHHGLQETLEWRVNQPDLTPEAHCWQKETESLKTDLRISQKQERRKDQKMALRINQKWTSLVVTNQGLQRKATEVGTRAKATILRQRARSLVIKQQQQNQIRNSLRATRRRAMMRNPKSLRALKKIETGLKRRREINLMKRRTSHMTHRGALGGPRSRGARIKIRIKIKRRTNLQMYL